MYLLAYLFSFFGPIYRRRSPSPDSPAPTGVAVCPRSVCGRRWRHLSHLRDNSELQHCLRVKFHALNCGSRLHGRQSSAHQPWSPAQPPPQNHLRLPEPNLHLWFTFMFAFHCLNNTLEKVSQKHPRLSICTSLLFRCPLLFFFHVSDLDFKKTSKHLPICSETTGMRPWNANWESGTPVHKSELLLTAGEKRRWPPGIKLVLSGTFTNRRGKGKFCQQQLTPPTSGLLEPQRLCNFHQNAPVGNKTYLQRRNTSAEGLKRSAGARQLWGWNTANRLHTRPKPATFHLFQRTLGTDGTGRLGVTPSRFCHCSAQV